jgi:hypothetical protein
MDLITLLQREQRGIGELRGEIRELRDEMRQSHRALQLQAERLQLQAERHHRAVQHIGGKMEAFANVFVSENYDRRARLHEVFREQELLFARQEIEAERAAAAPPAVASSRSLPSAMALSQPAADSRYVE